MMNLRSIRKTCIAYTVLLTVLLLVKNPLALFQSSSALLTTYRFFDSVTHWIAFTGLALLMLASRWPVATWQLFGGLAVYSCVTEAVQSLIPRRATQLGDLAQDLLGLATGALIFAIVARWNRSLPAHTPNDNNEAAHAPDGPATRRTSSTGA